MFYGLLALAAVGGFFSFVKSGGHVKVGDVAAKPTASAGKSTKTRLSPDDPEYIRQFRLCLAGVGDACKRVGKNADGSDRAGAGGDFGEDGPVAMTAPEAGRYDDPSSKTKAKDDLFDARVVRIALESARSLTACGKSKAEKCAPIIMKSAETIASLKKLEERAGRACRNRQHDACLIRGDLDEALGRRNDALVWFEKARSHAANVQSRCAGGAEKRKPSCKAADDTLTAALERETRIKELRIKGH